MGGRCQPGSAPAGGCHTEPAGGLWPGEPKTFSGMERGWRLVWDDERRGDVGEEGVASLGLRCVARGGCGVCRLRDLLGRAARGSP